VLMGSLAHGPWALDKNCYLDTWAQTLKTSKWISYRYESGQQSEADESTDLILISQSDIAAWTIPDELAVKLTHHAIGGLRLYHQFLNL
jgi:hypothetical protein